MWAKRGAMGRMLKSAVNRSTDCVQCPVSVEAEDFQDVAGESPNFKGSLILSLNERQLWSSVDNGYRVILLDF